MFSYLVQLKEVRLRSPNLVDSEISGFSDKHKNISIIDLQACSQLTLKSLLPLVKLPNPNLRLITLTDIPLTKNDIFVLKSNHVHYREIHISLKNCDDRWCTYDISEVTDENYEKLIQQPRNDSNWAKKNDTGQNVKKGEETKD